MPRRYPKSRRVDAAMTRDGRRSRWLLVSALGVIGVAVALMVIARGGSTATAPTATSSTLVRSLCASQNDAVRGARAEFYNHTHQAIHDLAALIQGRDRSTEGLPLEAMQRVEADLDATPSPDDLVSHLSALGNRARDAAVAAGQPRPQPC